MGLIEQAQTLLGRLKRRPLNRFTIDQQDQVDLEVSITPQVDVSTITNPQLDAIDAEVKFTKRF